LVWYLSSYCCCADTQVLGTECIIGAYLDYFLRSTPVIYWIQLLVSKENNY